MSNESRAIFYRVSNSVSDYTRYEKHKIATVEIDIYLAQPDETYFSDYDLVCRLHFLSSSIQEEEKDRIKPTSYPPSRWLDSVPDWLNGVKFCGYFAPSFEIKPNNLFNASDKIQDAARLMAKLAKVIEKYNLLYVHESDEFARIIDALQRCKARQLSYSRTRSKLVAQEGHHFYPIP